jgi:HK97 family phage prohead protease
MPNLSELLKSVRSRRSRTGVVTADRYFREVEKCFGTDFCPIKVAGVASEEEWQKSLKEAERQLTYSTSRTRVLPKSIKSSKGSDFIAEFECIVTTPRRDRDRDVLDTKGAKIDPDQPLLMQHVAMMPIGKRLKTIAHSDGELRFRSGIADCELGRDNLGLVKAGVLRISHGFTPLEWEPMKDEDGWHFKRFEIYEHSLVSIPSNVDAVVTSFSEKDFRTDLMRGWYGAIRQQSGKRKSSVATVPADITDTERVEYDGKEFIPVKVHDQIVEALAKANHKLANQSIAEIERSYLAELAKADTDVVRKSHRVLSLILRSREDQEEAKQWDDFMSQISSTAEAVST